MILKIKHFAQHVVRVGRQCYNKIMSEYQEQFTKYINNLLSSLDITNEQTQVLMQLYAKSPQSVLQLARTLKWSRNKVYRVISELIKLQLVSKVQGRFGAKFATTGPSALERIVKQKQQALKKAKTNLKKLFNTLPYINNANLIDSRVIHYQGIEGLKQVNWNLIHTKRMYRVYEVSRLSEYLDKDFAESLRLEWLRRKIYSRDLTNDKEIEDWTNVTEFATKYSDYRYIDPKILEIKTEIYIYNNVVTILQYDTMKYDPNSIFCVEIYNQALADFQKQIFDILWSQAKPMKLLSKRGKRVVEE